MRANKPDFKVVCANDKAEIYLYDVIGEDFFGGISAKMFTDEMKAAKSAKVIDLHINSPGGDVFDGNAIYTQLRAHRATVNVFVDGVAASIASVIAMAGDSIEISPNGYFMIHQPTGGGGGTAQDHRQLADLLDKVTGTIAETYARKTDTKPAAWLDTMAAGEKWYTAQESIDAGLADKIGAAGNVAACAGLKLFNYRFVPEAWKLDSQSPPNPIVKPADYAERIRLLTEFNRSLNPKD